jgi:hypothetical protein
MSLTTPQLCSLLDAIPEIRVTQEAAGVRVYVPAVDRSMPIDAHTVRQHEYVTGPNGDRALLLLVDVMGVSVQVIVASTDLVFAPDTLDSGLGITVDVANAPPLVSFSEMMRDLSTVESKVSTVTDFDKVMGTLVMLRYFVRGARRLGIECGDAESRLQKLWDATGLSTVAPTGSVIDHQLATPPPGSRRRRTPRKKTAGRK